MSQSEHKHVGQWQIPASMMVLLVLLCVVGTSWGIWRWMQKPAVNSDAIAVDPPTRGPGRRAANHGTVAVESYGSTTATGRLESPFGNVVEQQIESQVAGSNTLGREVRRQLGHLGETSHCFTFRRRRRVTNRFVWWQTRNLRHE